MAARFLNRTVVGLSLRPLLFPPPCVSMISLSAKTTLLMMPLSHHRSLLSLSAKTTLTMALSHRSFSSLKTLNLSHRSFPPPVVSLSLSSFSLRRQPMSSRSDLSFSSEVNELVDKYNEKIKNNPEDLRKEYHMELEKLFEKKDYSFKDVTNLQWFYEHLFMKRWEVVHVAEGVDELLAWFDKDILKAKEITHKLRNDLEIIIANDNQELVEDLEDMFWTLYDIHEKAIRAKAEPKDNKPRYLEAYLGSSTWKANNFIVKLNELLDWFDKETMEAYDTIQKLRKAYETIFANLLALERLEFEDEDEFDDHSRYKFLKELETMFWNLKKKQSKAILAKYKTNELADKQAQIWGDLANYCESNYSVDELLDWFDKEAMEANDTIQNLRKDYETIFAKLFADERPLLVEDVEDLHDFRWEILVKASYSFEGYSFDYRLKSKKESSRRCVQIPITGINHIKGVNEDLNQLFGWFEKETMKFKDIIEKLRKDHRMIAQKLQLANDEEYKAVLLEELKEMFSNLSEKQSKAIHAKARAAKALDYKAKAAELLSCFFVF